MGKMRIMGVMGVILPILPILVEARFLYTTGVGATAAAAAADGPWPASRIILAARYAATNSTPSAVVANLPTTLFTETYFLSAAAKRLRNCRGHRLALADGLRRCRRKAAALAAVRSYFSAKGGVWRIFALFRTQNNCFHRGIKHYSPQLLHYSITAKEGQFEGHLRHLI